MSAGPLLIDVTVLFVVALCGVHLARKAPAAVRHLILTSAFGTVAVLPVAMLVGPSMTVEIRALPPRAAEPIAAVPADAGSSSAEAFLPAPAAVASTASEGSVTIARWIRLVWAVVGLLALAPVGASMWRLRTIRRAGRPWADGAARLNALAREAAMRRPVALRLHDEIVVPITGGLLRPVIVLPSDAATWSEQQVGNALVHELAHVRRRDWPVHLVARALCAAYWFHPLAWMAWRALRLEAERACDDAVLARSEGTTYAEQLLMLARRLVQRPRPAQLSMASGSDLSSRITAVLDVTRPRGPAGWKATACIVAAAGLAVVALAPLRAAGPLPEPAVTLQSERASGPSAVDGQSAGQGLPRGFASQDHVDVPGDSATLHQQITTSPEPQAPVTLTLRTAGNRLLFKPGETIPIELTFESSVRQRYLVDGVTYDRSGRLTIDQFLIAPLEPVTDPLLDFFATYIGYVGGGVFTTGMLGDKPFAVTVDLNEWFRFDTPGTYRLSMRSSRVTDETRRTLSFRPVVPVDSNVATFQIVPRDAAWEDEEVARAVKILNAPAAAGGMDARTACRTLRFLGNDAAVTEMVRRYDDQRCQWDFMAGLFSAPDRERVVRLMEAGLSVPDQPISQGYLHTLALLSVYVHHPELRAAQTADAKGRLIARGAISKRQDLVQEAEARYAAILAAARRR